MRYSKILLNAGSFLLPLIGAFAAAAAHRVNPVYYSTGTACIRVDSEFQNCDTPVTPVGCTALIDGVHRQLFASINPLNSRRCLVPLFKFE